MAKHSARPSRPRPGRPPSRSARRAAEAPAPGGRTRLQRFLADAGVASRRHAEDYIRAGRVLVNGRVIDELPAFIDPAVDQVIFDGRPVKPEAPAYLLMNKPAGVVCTDRDPAGRKRAVDLIPDGLPRMFVVGRLDAAATGLLLLTNDGELAAQVAHPRSRLPRVYQVEVSGSVADDLPAQLRKGVYLAEGRAAASDVAIDFRGRDRSGLRVTLSEGRNQDLRRMLARLGHRVRKLHRVSIGALTVKGLASGECRRPGEKELSALRRDLARAAADPQSPPPKKKRRRRDGIHERQGRGRDAGKPREEEKRPRRRIVE